jgi:DNA helicase TIP49 (TBP-interacting protein)
MSEIQEYDLVVLIQDIQVVHKETLKKILLRRGQVGTVLMDFDQKAFLVDFADEEGVTYAMETIAQENLIPLIYQPVELLAS